MQRLTSLRRGESVATGEKVASIFRELPNHRPGVLIDAGQNDPGVGLLLPFLCSLRCRGIRLMEGWVFPPWIDDFLFPLFGFDGHRWERS